VAREEEEGIRGRGLGKTEEKKRTISKKRKRDDVFDRIGTHVGIVSAEL
jgi:hypothetical protein